MASVEGIHPKSQALELEAPLPGVLDALAALPPTQKARRFRSRVGHRLGSLARLGVFLLLLWVAGTFDGPLSIVAGVLAFCLGAVLWFRSLLPRRFHAEGHPGDALNRRPELVRRVLLRLKEDLVPNTPVRLRLRPDPRPEGPTSPGRRSPPRPSSAAAPPVDPALNAGQSALRVDPVSPPRPSLAHRAVLFRRAAIPTFGNPGGGRE
ncbi:hypothetical protein [Corallococcus exiguus]|uniref:hypothetical protein n=1 Tax=Corallococcus exiguus TaxID=83462 RepID=UPI001494FC79|nr:hypothetical protein [Corallococcus exiguus]NPD23129.1 hypothetical protein [Corallococcus exiguus]